MNRKTVLAIVLMALAVVYACAQQYDPESDFKAEPVDGGKSVRIIDYLGDKREVKIPPRIRRLPVTHIGNAFHGKNITSVIIPDSITSIGNGAFNYNQLTSVTIPNRVTSIDNFAFANNQLTSVIIPNSIKSIGENAFFNNQLSSVNISNSVTVIENGAFSKNQLSSVIIPNSVTIIDRFAFANNQLTNVVIPNSVIDIRGGAFQNNQFTSVTIGENVSLGSFVTFVRYLPAFNDDFDNFYKSNGRKAGTYTLNSGTWSAVYR